MNILIASDHAGFQYKKKIIKSLKEKYGKLKDFGTNKQTSVDYPDIIHPLARYMNNTKDNIAIIICGTANGVAMTINKYENIRAAVCWKKKIAALAKNHNNANVIAIPARHISFKKSMKIINTFLNENFEGGRHKRRIDKIIK